PPYFSARLNKFEGGRIIPPPPDVPAEEVGRASAGQDGRKLPQPEIRAQEVSAAVVADLEGANYLVRSVGTREKRRNPVASFITSTLQQEAARKLRFSVKRTMMLAQRLYEGIELGKEGAVGLITYMRTDSTRIAGEAIDEVRGFIGDKYGAPYLPQAPNVCKSRKEAQDAH